LRKRKTFCLLQKRTGERVSHKRSKKVKCGGALATRAKVLSPGTKTGIGVIKKKSGHWEEAFNSFNGGTMGTGGYH